MAGRWKNHDGSPSRPAHIDPDAVLELEGFDWSVSALPAGATDWATVLRYRETGKLSKWRPEGWE